MSKLTPSPFAAFYRPTGKGRVTRYGSPPGDRSIIGAVFGPSGAVSGIDTGLVIALSHDEQLRYSREYARAVREGALVVATAAEYEASVSPQKSGAVKEK